MDDELARARRALRGVDPDMDLARVYGESRSRARRASDPTDTVLGAVVTRGPVHIEVIEVRLSEPPAQYAGIVGRHRRQAIAWGALAASVVIVGLAVGMSGAHSPTWPRDLPPGATGTASPAEPSLSPLPGDVVARAAKAMSADGICVLQTTSTLGDASATRADPVNHPRTDQQNPFLVHEPLDKLQAVAVDAVLGLGEDTDLAGPGTEEYLGAEQLDGTEVVRIRITPSSQIRTTRSDRFRITPSDGIRTAPLDPGIPGEVTRIDYLVDAATWLPRVEETWITSDEGEQLVLHSEFGWLGCDEQSLKELEVSSLRLHDSGL